MKDVNREAMRGMLRMFLLLPLLVFLPAWTLNYWQAWLCLGVFFACVIAITTYLMKANPALLERRLKAGASAEKEKSQKVIQSLAAVAFVALFVLPGLDHRFSWSAVPAFAVIAGDALIVVGFVFVLWVFKVNSFTSGVIEVAAEQEMIATGPYAMVRHPMYLGSLVMLLGIPLGLGSWCGELAIVPMTIVIIWRLIEEERFLGERLVGYTQYKERVRYRLVPTVW
jgi:protein-S-isoprenylcysteine O-methyltransferase Ste14